MNTMAKPVSAGKSASRSLKTSSPPAEAQTPTTGMTALAGPTCSGASAVKARSPSASVSGWIPPGISFSSMMVPFSLWLWQSKGDSMPRYRQRGRPPCLPLWKLLSPDDVDRDFRGDVAVEPHRHLELAELFNRFVQLNLPAIDGEVQRPERAGNVLRRYGAEQLVVLAGLLRDGHAHAVHEFGQVLRLALELGFLAHVRLALLLHDLTVGFGGRHRPAPGEEENAGGARGGPPPPDAAAR